jgi:hypothetical protein
MTLDYSLPADSDTFTVFLRRNMEISTSHSSGVGSVPFVRI